MTGTVIGLAALSLVLAAVAVLLAVTGGPHLMIQTRAEQKETT